MGQPLSPWTPDSVRALPDDGNRYEVVDGVLLVTPAPGATHQRAVGALHVRLHGFLAARRLGEVLISPADIQLDDRSLVQPDLFVLPAEPRVHDWSDVRRLLLVVEILSPTTKRRDRGIKRELYQRTAVDEYWIVDPDARTIERWLPGDERGELLRDSITWRPDPEDEPLVINLPTLFREIWRE